MADDIKRVNCVKVCFSDRLFIDLGREAARQDRTVAELVHLIVRRHMYGNYVREDVSAEVPNQD
mgnify:CR=1 FL=1